MTQPSLDFAAVEPRTVTASSLAAYADVTLPLQDLLMVLHVDDYLRSKRAFGYQDVTGGELAAYLGRRDTQVRPRLTGGKKAGWLRVNAMRKSRCHGERSCEPYALAVPRAAVERAIEQARGAKSKKQP